SQSQHIINEQCLSVRSKGKGDPFALCLSQVRVTLLRVVQPHFTTPCRYYSVMRESMPSGNNKHGRSTHSENAEFGMLSSAVYNGGHSERVKMSVGVRRRPVGWERARLGKNQNSNKSLRPNWATVG